MQASLLFKEPDARQRRPFGPTRTALCSLGVDKFRWEERERRHAPVNREKWRLSPPLSHRQCGRQSSSRHGCCGCVPKRLRERRAGGSAATRHGLNADLQYTTGVFGHHRLSPRSDLCRLRGSSLCLHACRFWHARPRKGRYNTLRRPVRGKGRGAMGVPLASGRNCPRAAAVHRVICVDASPRPCKNLSYDDGCRSMCRNYRTEVASSKSRARITEASTR